MKKLIIILFILLFAIPIYSQTTIAGQQQYSLRECLELAINNNPDIKLANAQVSVASAALTSAFGDYLPSVNFNWGYSRQLNADGGKTVNVGGQLLTIDKTEPNSFNMSAIASITIFNGFGREYQYSRAQDNLNYQFFNIKNTIQKVYINVYRQYVEVIKNMQLVKIRRDNLELGKKLLERIKARYEAGAISSTLVFSQEADLGNREFELVRSENDLNISKSNLLVTLGMTPDLGTGFSEESLPLDISDGEIKNFSTEIGSFESALSAALNSRQDYQANKLLISSSKTAVKLAGTGYLPNLSASGGWSWNNSQFSDFSDKGRSFIGLSLQVPIFENFKTNYQLESSRVQVLQNELQQFQLEQSIKASLKSCYYNLEAAQKQLEISKKSLLSAEKNYENINEGLKVGTVTSTDFLMANSTLINAQINRISAVYSYFIAQKEILFATGKIYN